MKGAKVTIAAPEAAPGASTPSTNRRSQPVRQTRMNPTSALRSTAANTASNAPAEPAIGRFPAVTHIADALSSLPKELVRHFTLLKELDARIHAPEVELFSLADACLNAPMPGESAAGGSSGVKYGAEASLGVDARPIPNTLGIKPDSHGHMDAVMHTENVDRRTLFREAARKMSEMISMLEEKNTVISSANEVLDKHIARIDRAWPFLEQDFSEETKWGSSNHWAYPENRVKDGRRRDNVSTVGDEVAARSDNRKQALAAKKEKKQQQQQQQEQDMEEKKSKSRRGTDQSNGTNGAVSNPVTASGANSTKRRKTEKGAAAVGSSTSGDKASSSNSNGKNNKTPASPATGAVDSRKRKAPGGNSGQGKKRNGVTASTATSPVLGAIAEVPSADETSPMPTFATRAPIPRGRQNSTTSTGEHNKSRRPSVSSNKTNGTPITPELGSIPPVTLPPRSMPDHMVNAGSAKIDHRNSEPASVAGSVAGNLSPRKRDASLARIDDSGRSTTTTPVLPPSLPLATTKSGRVSKPSTPALATLQEAPVRVRTSRSHDGTKDPKRKKGSSGNGQPQQQTSSEGLEVVEEQEVEGEDANEPRYCYCNGVSYGAMVACDAEGCKGEWFHLACVGLKVAPKQNAKWYCAVCKEKNKSLGKKR